MKRKEKMTKIIFLIFFLVMVVLTRIEAVPPSDRVIPGRFIIVLKDEVTNPGEVAQILSHRHGLVTRHVYRAALKGFSANIPAQKMQAVKADPRVSYVEPDLVVRAIEEMPPLPPDISKYAALEETPPLPPDISKYAALEKTPSLPPEITKYTNVNNKGGVKGKGGGDTTSLSQKLPTGIDRVDADAAIINIDGVDKKMIDGNDERVDVDIAVIDTGISMSHPDLNVVSGETFCFCPVKIPGDDDNGHGSHVAGTAAATDNGLGVVGVAPGARLWAVKVLDRWGGGSLADLLAGIEYVTANAGEIEVANMSLGAVGRSDALRTAISNSVNAGVLYVVAAGNEGRDVYGADGVFNTADDFIPAAYPEVVTVSAMVDHDGQPGALSGPSDDIYAGFSNFSGNVVDGNPVIAPGAAIDLAAPGYYIESTYKKESYKVLSGTSMAAPHVAGAAALYIAIDGKPQNADDVAAIRQVLIKSGASAGAANGFTGCPDGNPEPLLDVGNLINNF